MKLITLITLMPLITVMTLMLSTIPETFASEHDVVCSIQRVMDCLRHSAEKKQ